MTARTNQAQLLINKEPIHFQWPTMDPFLFCAYHYDKYPESNKNYGPNANLSGRDIGSDFARKDGWNMYHGRRVPGFPGHPHRGFETVTVVERGYVDHADSLGAAGRYANGDLQWMTAGAGVQHSEMFPLLDRNRDENGNIDNTLELFQIWLNLPSHKKFSPPHFTMHWNEKIPKLTIEDEKGNQTLLILYAGKYQEENGLTPPPDSWASDPNNHVWIWVLELNPHAKFTIPATEEGITRNLYYYSGSGASLSSGEKLSSMHRHQLDESGDNTLLNGSSEISRFLLLQGRPIAEPVVQYGPFVMNSAEEIQKTFEDYRRTEFGGWGWNSHDVVHGTEGRFAKHADGKMEIPE